MADDRAPILAIGANGGVVQLPGRHFPGLVIQGDSLHILLGVLAEAKRALAEGDTAEARDCIDEAIEAVAGRVEFYESTLSAAGMALPYRTKPS